MTCICHFIYFYVLPRASYMYIQHGTIPGAVRRLYNNIFTTFRFRKVSIKRRNILQVRCGHSITAYLAGIWRDGMYVWPSVCPSVCSDICMCIFPPFVYQYFMHLLVHLYIYHLIHASNSTILSNVLSLHLCRVTWQTSSHMTGNTRCCRLSFTGWTFSLWM